MHFALRGYLFVALTALLAIAGTWSEDPAFARAWALPAFLLLTGLCFERWRLGRTSLRVGLQYEDRLKLGRTVPGAFVFEHSGRRALEVEYARVLPAQLRQSLDVRRVEVPAEEALRDPIELLPLRLGPGQFGDVPARLLGSLRLAWWSRSLKQDARFTVAPDTLRRGARAVAGESAGETPRRLPGTGLELLQLREYSPGDAIARIDWKATARRGTLISREYAEAQHLEILIVIDASRASRARAGALDRLGLYANVAARLAEHAVSIEDRVGLLVYSSRTHAACLPDRGVRAVSRLRRALETLESERGEPDALAAAMHARRLLTHRGLIVWLTDLADPVRTEELLRAQRTLVPRHQPIIAAPRAVEISRLATATAHEWNDPAIILAAREQQRAAALAVAKLQRAGAVVLDEPDDKLDKAVLDSYLLLRRRRRI
jgi:uncharacterized protein (DUF58 family)